MAVRAYSPVLPSIELFGAYEGIAVATGVNQTVSLTFTPTSEGNLTIVPYDGDGNISEFQLEAASTPSSYIPTPEGSTATRAAETLTIPAANLPWPEPVVIGDELVTNGTFDEDTGWTLGTGWTISGGVASKDNTATSSDYLEQTLSLIDGKTYIITFTISNVTNASNMGISSSGAFGNIAAADRFLFGPGTKTITAVYRSSSGASLRFVASDTNTTFDLDNISVREINPLSVSIQMDGRMTYADEGIGVSADGQSGQVVFSSWRTDGSNYIAHGLSTGGSAVGQFVPVQEAVGTFDLVTSTPNAYSPDILVPFNLASRHGSTFINGAVDGVALTADTTPVALPDLSATDLSLGYDMMGTIKLFRMWSEDIGDTGLEQST